MGDDESRREDARIEALIDRELRDGRWGYCFVCKDPTPEYDEDGRRCCKYCQNLAED